MATKKGKISEIAFITKAIEARWAEYQTLPAAKRLNDRGVPLMRYPAIHSTFDGLNAAFNAYYGVDCLHPRPLLANGERANHKPECAVTRTQALAASGQLVCIPAVRGVRISLPGVIPTSSSGFTGSGDSLLTRMGLSK